MSDMDILVKIGYLDAEEPDVDILPANLEHLKYAFAEDCAGVAKMNAYKENQVIEREMTITDIQTGQIYTILFDIINYYLYDFVNIVFYESENKTEQEYIKMLTTGKYTWDGVQVFYYTLAE